MIGYARLWCWQRRFRNDYDGNVTDALHHKSEHTTDHQAAPIIIVGTGLAGYGLAREFRHDAETPLILITHDDGRSYSKPMLSTGYTKNTEARIWRRPMPAAWLEH